MFTHSPPERYYWISTTLRRTISVDKGPPLVPGWAPFVGLPLPFVRRPGAVEVEAVEVHDLVPGGDEVAHELLLRVVAGVDLGQGAELGVRAEDQVDPARAPPELAGGAVAALEGPVRGLPPLGGHVEEVHEEVVGQRARPLG